VQDLEARLMAVNTSSKLVRKWAHMLGDVSTVLVAIDMASYDIVLGEDESSTQLWQTWYILESLFRGSFPPHTPYLLVFTNASLCKRKLHASPLEKFIPEQYLPGRSELTGVLFENDAVDAVMKPFFALNADAERRVYATVAEPSDLTGMEQVFRTLGAVFSDARYLDAVATSKGQ
jgi:hypothetical protein